MCEKLAFRHVHCKRCQKAFSPAGESHVICSLCIWNGRDTEAGEVEWQAAKPQSAVTGEEEYEF